MCFSGLFAVWRLVAMEKWGEVASFQFSGKRDRAYGLQDLFGWPVNRTYFHGSGLSLLLLVPVIQPGLGHVFAEATFFEEVLFQSPDLLVARTSGGRVSI